jgi:hypothetical protein
MKSNTIKFLTFLESLKNNDNNILIESVKKGFKTTLLEGRDHLYIGSAPYDEDCAQLGTNDYKKRCKLELTEFKRQLIDKFGPPPAGVELKVKGQPHDFGTYYELVVVFDDENETASDYAFDLEDHGIETWDEEAKEKIESYISTENTD